MPATHRREETARARGKTGPRGGTRLVNNARDISQRRRGDALFRFVWSMAIFSLSATSHRAAARRSRVPRRITPRTRTFPLPRALRRAAAPGPLSDADTCPPTRGRPVDRLSERYLGHPARIPSPSLRGTTALQRGPCRDRHTCNWLSKTVCIGIIRFPFDFVSPSVQRCRCHPRRRLDKGEWSARCRSRCETRAPHHPSSLRRAGCRKFVIHARVTLHRVRLGSG